MTKAQLLAVGSTAGLESGGNSPASCLTDEQRRQIRQAAQAVYDKLRWYLGDSRELMGELQLLARDSFLQGMSQERSNALSSADAEGGRLRRKVRPEGRNGGRNGDTFVQF